MFKFPKILTGLLLVLLIAGYFFILKNEKTLVLKNIENNTVVAPEDNRAATNKIVADEQNIASNTTPEIPNKILIDVPFISQAPFANWDIIHEESCEEASLIMVKYFLDGKKLTPQIAEQEIQTMVDFEIKNYGDYKDSNAQQIIRLAKDFYNIHNLKAIYDFSKEDIKNYLAKKNPIIVPAAGRLLKNPNFTPPGPLYHNLVLVGYDGDTIVTNDPGTRKGQGYTYNIDTLYGAIHDFPGKKEDIEKGRKAMLVLEWMESVLK